MTRGPKLSSPKRRLMTSAAIHRVAFLGDHRPRQCGIATFTTDICEAVAAEFPHCDCIARAVNDRPEGYDYPARIRFEVDEKELDSYRRPGGKSSAGVPPRRADAGICAPIRAIARSINCAMCSRRACRAALHPDRVSQNMGAESSLAFYLSLAEMTRAEILPILATSPTQRSSANESAAFDESSDALRRGSVCA